MPAATIAELVERRYTIDRYPILQDIKQRLRSFLTPLLTGPIYLPEQKALLSRNGGVCQKDGSRLLFDPSSPDSHTCPRCAQSYGGERHHRAWVVRYHLWLSERAVHLALLGVLEDEPVLSRCALEILNLYAERYDDYPNRDNVLGPSHLFFSTYLESIWLLQVAIAGSLLETGAAETESAQLNGVRSMVGESASLIASFDEGCSNRQVWNNAALIAAGLWLDSPQLVELGADSGHGIREQLDRAVTGEGFWFEGENYHFFALRGFLLAAELLRQRGENLYADNRVGRKLAAMYTAPLDTMMPDLKVPARSDSPFGVSLLQPRFAELWEIGRARLGEPRLEGILAAVYQSAVPSTQDFGASEIAEFEQNRDPQMVNRSMLGWKALLWMDPTGIDADSTEWQAGSLVHAEAGIAILRPAGRYVSVECGGRRGGHGHPDLLHVNLVWKVPWLLDFGTGSYVAESLHWYRSTLAHNAPGVSGRGQLYREGYCVAIGGEGDWSWCIVEALELFGKGTRALRTVVIGPNYVLDVVDVTVPNELQIDLPVHALGDLDFEEESVDYSENPDETSNAWFDQSYGSIAAKSVKLDARKIRAARNGHTLDVHIVPRPAETLLVAEAPGPPDIHFADGPPLSFLVRRAAGSGRWVHIYILQPSPVQEVHEAGAVIRVKLTDGTLESVEVTDAGLVITDAEGRVCGATVEPTVRVASESPHPVHPVRKVVACPLLDREPPLREWREHVPQSALHELGEMHYRRSEEPYPGTDTFGALACVFVVGSSLYFAVDVTKPSLIVRPLDAPDPGWDNELPDIHSDGIQCYAALDDWEGYLAVPDIGSDRLVLRAVAGTAGETSRVRGRWFKNATGVSMVVALSADRPFERGDRILVNLVVNEMRPGRDRRAGQLVLSGDAGWVYLRGDRESAAGALVAEVR